LGTAVAELETIRPQQDQPLTQGLPVAVFDPVVRYLDYLAGGARNTFWRSSLPHVTLEQVEHYPFR
jgi:hypothetical protein